VYVTYNGLITKPEYLPVSFKYKRLKLA